MYQGEGGRHFNWPNFSFDHNRCTSLHVCIVDRQTRRRTPSAKLKDHFPSDSSEHVSATSGVEEDVHTKNKVGTSGIDESRKKATSKCVCFSSSPKRKPEPVSSPSKNVSEGAKQQRTSPRKKSKAPLSALKSGGKGGRAKRDRKRSHSDGTVCFKLFTLYAHVHALT